MTLSGARRVKPHAVPTTRSGRRCFRHFRPTAYFLMLCLTHIIPAPFFFIPLIFETLHSHVTTILFYLSKSLLYIPSITLTPTVTLPPQKNSPIRTLEINGKRLARERPADCVTGLIPSTKNHALNDRIFAH